MRKSRVRKYKPSTYRSFWFTAKIVMICYLLLFIGTYFTSNTSAVFTSIVEPKGSIDAANWLEGQYELEFDMSGNPHRTCIVDTTVKNLGPGDMVENVKFDVFYVKNGNPIKKEKVGEGKINALKSGESTNVSYEANKTGRYVFIVDGKDKKFESKKFNVECNPDNKTTTNQLEMEESNKVTQEIKDKEIENVDEQVLEEDKKENKTESTEPKQQEEQVEVKEEIIEESIETEQSTEKPLEEHKQKTVETKPEEETNSEQVTEEGEE